MPALECEHPLRKDTYALWETSACLRLPNRKVLLDTLIHKIILSPELKAPQMLQTLPVLY